MKNKKIRDKAYKSKYLKDKLKNNNNIDFITDNKQNSKIKNNKKDNKF